MWTYFGICLFAEVGLATRPGTTYYRFAVTLTWRIEEWAVVQAKLRMEEDGINLYYKVGDGWWIVWDSMQVRERRGVWSRVNWRWVHMWKLKQMMPGWQGGDEVLSGCFCCMGCRTSAHVGGCWWRPKTPTICWRSGTVNLKRQSCIPITAASILSSHRANV
jgi:hypothetical protein